MITFDRGALRDMMARWPELGERKFRTLLGAAPPGTRPEDTG